MSNLVEDTRELCKYGAGCYQKNPEHHRRFKHPKRKSEEVIENIEKKQKMLFEINDKKENVNDNEDKKMVNDKHVEEHVHVKLEDVNVNKEDVNVNKEDVNENKEDVNENEEDETEPTICDKNSLSIDLSKIDSIKEKIETVFLVKMPQDFFSFYDFCESINKSDPKTALAAVGLLLAGPFDLIRNDLVSFDQSVSLRHCRYYYDPPEFQTVLKCDDKNLLHYGYFRDDPKEEPVFVSSNEAAVDCKLNIVSENLFGAVNFHIDKVKKNSDPFKKIKIQKIQNSLAEWSKKNGYSLDTLTKKMRARRSQVVAKTFHGAGIVVPFNKRTELGYRELKENDVNLKKILQKIVNAETEEDRKMYWGKLQPVVTYASIANDECDFGTGLELGLDLFSFGNDILHKAVLQTLSTSYNLLGRNEFAIILESHLKNRKKSGDVCTIAL